MRKARACWLIWLSLLLASCSDTSNENHALRFSVLPDWNKGELQKNSEALATILTKHLGVDVAYVPSNDYTACVNALIANKVDFVWLGGKTTCDAIDEGKGSVHVLATRDIDLRFRSYFIGNREAIAAGKVDKVDDLASWSADASKLSFSFGSQNSTSGHLMPRHFLVAAGIDPDQDFKNVSYQVGHGATLSAVASGAVDVGALNYAYYDQASDEIKAKAPILYATDEYVDYAWVVHDRIGPDLVDKLRSTLLGMSRDNAEEAAILDAWAAGKFLSAKDEQWQSIRDVRDSLPKGFLK